MVSKTQTDRIYCWELLATDHPLLEPVRCLYESALAEEERIPWEWLRRAVQSRAEWRPGGWGNHLIVASPGAQAESAEELAGFASVVHLPGFGGYIGYVAVAEPFRKCGVGGRLFQQSFQVLATDASAVDERLPFVLWESRKPDADAPPSEWKNWEARLKLFTRSGGYWLEGVTLWSPNWNEPTEPEVPLQLFLTPMAEPRESFTSDRLQEVVAGFLKRVYKSSPGDAVWERAFEGVSGWRLRPPLAASRRRELVRA